MDQHRRGVDGERRTQPFGEAGEPRTVLGQQVRQRGEGLRDRRTDACGGQVMGGDVGRVEAGHDPAEPRRGGHGAGVCGEGGEIAPPPVLGDEHGAAVAPAPLLEGGQVQRAPAVGDLQQRVQGAGGDAQHLAGAREQQQGVAAGVVAQHPRGAGARSAPQHAVDLAAEAGVAEHVAAEQERSPVGVGPVRDPVLAHLAAATGRAAQDVVPLVAGGDQQHPPGLVQRASRQVGTSGASGGGADGGCCGGCGNSRSGVVRAGGGGADGIGDGRAGAGGAVGDQHGGVGLDPHPVCGDLAAQQGGEPDGVQQVLGAGEAGVIAQQPQRAVRAVRRECGRGRHGHRRTSWTVGAAAGAGVGGASAAGRSSASALRCSTIQRE